MATQTPSSSTSEVGKKRKRDHSSSPRCKYDVFLSFHGKDTRWGFTDHLHHDLKGKGIRVFRDDEALQRGEYISQALLKAIQDSQYAIVIFSTNYASSKWCLRELAEIVECSEEKTKLITIIPIFYYVDPSNVRNQRGTFAEAFAAHEKDPKVDIKEIDMWRNAFRKVGNIAGEHIHDKYESTIIQKVCGRISNELNSRYSRHDYDKLVAINFRVEEMLNLMDMESNDVRFIGIHGMGGVGKTTLAEIIYDRVSNSNYRFEGSSFISCIREKSTTARDLASLQKELISTIMQEEIHVWDHHQGIRMILKMLQNKKVFIVLDDVDSEKKLMALAGDRKWFGPGSRVIITCRDSHLLRTHEVNDIYKVELLGTTEALQLFSLSAFKQTHPTENYKALSMDFVKYSQGLPLALVVLGSFLFRREIDAWKSARDQLEANPNKEIMDALQISFDGLEYSQKELFLDMACLNMDHDEMLLEKLGHYRIDLDVLVEKSLISKSKYGRKLSMHDLLKDLGREIVHRECPEEPGRRSRLFRHEDVFHVLENDTGTDATKAIVAVDYYAHKTKARILNAKAFSKMRELRYLKFGNSVTIKWRGNPLKYMPINELRFLEWSGFQSQSWPSRFQPENLTVLKMRGSRIKQLWMGSMVLEDLKEFDLSFSDNLIEIPDLTGAPNLERIYLEGCRSLCELHPSIGSLKKLTSLNLDECSSLEKLPDLSCLECSTYRWASETAITQIHPSSFQLKNLIVLSMRGSRMKQLWKGLMVLPNLKEFHLSNSKNLIETPDLTGVPNLKEINLKGCTSLCELHPSIGSLKKLKSLRLDRCSSLEKLPDLSNLECLSRLVATETVITQLPSVNLRPNYKFGDGSSTVLFSFSGSKLMGLKSRDLINDIGSLVKYHKEGTYDRLEASWIDFDSKGENILDMAGGVVEALDGNLSMISGWWLGFHIPEWVEYKSKGSSVKIDLDANTNPEMGWAFFIVCDSDQFFSNDQLDYTSIRLVFEMDEEYFVEFNYGYRKIPRIVNVSLGKRIGLWVYIPEVLRFLDIRRKVMIKISWKTDRYCFLSKRPFEKEVEVEAKECGVHLVCPDDANSNFFNSIAPFGRSGSSSNSDVHRQFDAEMVNTGTRSTLCSFQKKKKKKGLGLRSYMFGVLSIE